MTRMTVPSHLPASATPAGDGVVVGEGPVTVDAYIDFLGPFCRQFELEEQWMMSLNLKFMGYVRSVRAVIGHMRERGEVAALVTFLASPRASFINGAHIPVDGAQRKAIMDR